MTVPSFPQVVERDHWSKLRSQMPISRWRFISREMARQMAIGSKHWKSKSRLLETGGPKPFIAAPPNYYAKCELRCGGKVQQCPLYSQKRTCAMQLEMSALGQKRISTQILRSAFSSNEFDRRDATIRYVLNHVLYFV